MITQTWKTQGGISTLPFGITTSEVDGKIVAADGISTAADSVDYLKREFKIDLQNAQQASMVEAISDPKLWLGKRKTALDALATSLAPTYTKYIKEYTDLGFPNDEAIARATEDLKRVYEIEAERLEIKNPGATVLFPALVERARSLNTTAGFYQNNVLGPSTKHGMSKEARKEYKKKVIAKYESKRK